MSTMGRGRGGYTQHQLSYRDSPDLYPVPYRCLPNNVVQRKVNSRVLFSDLSADWLPRDSLERQQSVDSFVRRLDFPPESHSSSFPLSF